jgi:hypothetical protein
VVRDAEFGRRYADKLAEVYTLDGAKAWVLVHIEIQGQPDPAFAERMYVYHYRLFDRYRRDVVSLAVLTDPRAAFARAAMNASAGAVRCGFGFRRSSYWTGAIAPLPWRRTAIRSPWSPWRICRRLRTAAPRARGRSFA